MDEFQTVETRHVAEHELRDQLDHEDPCPSISPSLWMAMVDGRRNAACHGSLGTRKGFGALQDVMDVGYELNIPYLTIYAFSQENWNRPATEIRLLMGLLEQYLEKERQRFHDRQVRFLPLDDSNNSQVLLRALVAEVAEETSVITRHGRWQSPLAMVDALKSSMPSNN